MICNEMKEKNKCATHLKESSKKRKMAAATAHPHHERLKVFNFSAFFALLLLPLISILVHYYTSGNNHYKFDSHLKIDKLIKWVQGKGGYVSPSVTLDIFNEGYGLKASAKVHEYDVLFRIPTSIVFSQENSIERYLTSVPHSTREQFIALLSTDSGDSMVFQDWIIAMSLMIECSLGKQSEFHPYLDILPHEVPRLDTFSDEELEMLQDKYLSDLAHQSHVTLRRVWERYIQDIVMVITRKKDTNALLNTSCVSFEAFHKYTAISSSRAMILNEKKYLTPLADMINHAPRNSIAVSPPPSFSVYHQLDHPSIVVKADRDVNVNNQIFEDYGALDNSLFIEAFGFVPYENPFHCVPIQLPLLKMHSTETILTHLDPSITGLDGQVKLYNSACVLLDGSLSDQRVYTYLALVALERGERQYYDRCLRAVGSGQDAKLYCVDYLDRRSAVASVLREAAKAALDQSPTSLDFDVNLLLRKSTPNNTVDSLRSIMALRFRLEDKKILTHIANKVL